MARVLPSPYSGCVPLLSRPNFINLYIRPHTASFSFFLFQPFRPFPTPPTLAPQSYPLENGPPKTMGSLVLPLLFILTVVSETVQRSIGGAASAVTGGTGVGSDGAPAGSGGLGAFAGQGGGVFGGGGGFAGTSLDAGRVLQGAGDVLDTLFVMWTVWYMLRFFRCVYRLYARVWA